MSRSPADRTDLPRSARSRESWRVPPHRAAGCCRQVLREACDGYPSTGRQRRPRNRSLIAQAWLGPRPGESSCPRVRRSAAGRGGPWRFGCSGRTRGLGRARAQAGCGSTSRARGRPLSPRRARPSTGSSPQGAPEVRSGGGSRPHRVPRGLVEANRCSGDQVEDHRRGCEVAARRELTSRQPQQHTKVLDLHVEVLAEHPLQGRLLPDRNLGEFGREHRVSLSAEGEGTVARCLATLHPRGEFKDPAHKLAIPACGHQVGTECLLVDGDVREAIAGALIALRGYRCG
jgi:hypothetical protein